MDLPLKVLCDLGGWKNAHTVLRCYQRADEGQLRKALEEPQAGIAAEIPIGGNQTAGVRA